MKIAAAFSFASDAVRAACLSALGASAGRELLTAARTYYVRSDGSDSNTGLADTSGGAFATIQKALDVAAGLDFGVHNVTIRVGNGTWTCNGNVLVKPYVGSGRLILSGDPGSSSAVVLNQTNNASGAYGTVTFAEAGSRLELRHLVIDCDGASDSYNVLMAQGGTLWIGPGVSFDGNSTRDASISTQGAKVFFESNWSVAGSMRRFLWGGGYSLFSFGGNMQVSFTSGTSNFSEAFVQLDSSYLMSWNLLKSGSHSGRRYRCTLNGVLNTYGSPNSMPGDTAGETLTGGQAA